MRALVAAMMVVGLLALPARAEPSDQQTPEELLGDAGQKFLQALQMMLMAIPQYAAPEINENGDIIIRRVRPDDEPAPPPTTPGSPAKPIQTST